MACVTPFSSSGAVLLPADLLVLLSRLFDSARSVLSFSLVCKRHHSVVLSKLHDKTNKQAQSLLSLHTRKIIGCNASGSAMLAVIYFALPNGTSHGYVEAWSIPHLPMVTQIIAEDTRMRPNHNYASDDYRDGHIYTAEKQQEVMKLIQLKNYCSNLMLQYNTYLGRKNGPFKEYNDPGSMTIECEYVDDKIQGKWFRYCDSRLQEVKDFNDGELHGWVESYNYLGMLEKKSHWKLGLRDGESEGYTRLPHCQHVVLTARLQYCEGQLHGVVEHWYTETGIRTLLSHWKNGKREGDNLAWYEMSGALKEHSVYKEGNAVSTQQYPDVP